MDHPHCAKCRFDLTGRWPDLAVCPECGSDVKQDGAVKHGRRRVRPMTLAAGILITAVALVLNVGRLMVVNGEVDLIRYKPTWLLMSDSRKEDQQTATRAIRELRRRVADNLLSKQEADELLACAFTLQADLEQVWLPYWGDLIEDHHKRGKLTDEQWKGYLHRGSISEMKIRSRIRRGDLLPFGHMHYSRHGSGGRQVNVGSGIDAWRIDPIGSAQDPPVQGEDDHEGTGADEEWYYWRDLPARPDLPPGEYTLTLSIRNVLTDVATGAYTMSWYSEVSAPFTIIPDGQDSDQPISDESLRDAVVQSIEIDSEGILATPHSDGSIYVRTTIEYSNVPIDVAFDVLIRHEDAEIHIGTSTHSSSRSIRYSHQLFAGSLIELPDADRVYSILASEQVDVILRANPQVARETRDIVEYWDGEIVFEDVPVVFRQANETTSGGGSSGFGGGSRGRRRGE